MQGQPRSTYHEQEPGREKNRKEGRSQIAERKERSEESEEGGVQAAVIAVMEVMQVKQKLQTGAFRRPPV
jgi:hypothetical protein